MKTRDPLLFLLQRFREQGVEYVKPEWFAPAPDEAGGGHVVHTPADKA